MARSTWAGYGGTAVARCLLHAFGKDWNRWEPIAALSIADAALVIAESSDRRTPAILFRAHVSRAHVLGLLNRFGDALASLEKAQMYAADTNCPRIHFAILAHTRAGVHYLGDSWPEALEMLEEARDGYQSCGDTTRLRYLRTFEAATLAAAQKYDDARRLARAGLDDAISLNDRMVIAMETGNIGLYLLEGGDSVGARIYLNRALAAYRTLGWRARSAQMLALLGRLEIRERGVDGLDMIERACLELNRLGVSGDWAEARLEIAEELLRIDPGAHVRRFCQGAYTRALSLGRSALAERALRLLEH